MSILIPHDDMKRGFTIIESFFMLAAIFVFTWICLGVLHKKGQWPFKPSKAAVVEKNAVSR